ncbi:hypothetical protein N0V90_000808 [Kalmusia sp. IMI 367209]|nr:hypothetical protein N0V90_000808 [Kalmusia sp. IMI 367209]
MPPKDSQPTICVEASARYDMTGTKSLEPQKWQRPMLPAWTVSESPDTPGLTLALNLPGRPTIVHRHVPKLVAPPSIRPVQPIGDTRRSRAWLKSAKRTHTPEATASAANKSLPKPEIPKSNASVEPLIVQAPQKTILDSDGRPESDPAGRLDSQGEKVSNFEPAAENLAHRAPNDELKHADAHPQGIAQVNPNLEIPKTEPPLDANITEPRLIDIIDLEQKDSGARKQTYPASIARVDRIFKDPGTESKSNANGVKIDFAGEANNSTMPNIPMAKDTVYPAPEEDGRNEETDLERISQVGFLLEKPSAEPILDSTVVTVPPVTSLGSLGENDLSDAPAIAPIIKGQHQAEDSQQSSVPLESDKANEDDYEPGELSEEAKGLKKLSETFAQSEHEQEIASGNEMLCPVTVVPNVQAQNGKESNDVSRVKRDNAARERSNREEGEEHSDADWKSTDDENEMIPRDVGGETKEDRRKQRTKSILKKIKELCSQQVLVLKRLQSQQDSVSEEVLVRQGPMLDDIQVQQHSAQQHSAQQHSAQQHSASKGKEVHDQRDPGSKMAEDQEASHSEELKIPYDVTLKDAVNLQQSSTVEASVCAQPSPLSKQLKIVFKKHNDNVGGIMADDVGKIRNKNEEGEENNERGGEDGNDKDGKIDNKAGEHAKKKKRKRRGRKKKHNSQTLEAQKCLIPRGEHPTEAQDFHICDAIEAVGVPQSLDHLYIITSRLAKSMKRDVRSDFVRYNSEQEASDFGHLMEETGLPVDTSDQNLRYQDPLLSSLHPKVPRATTAPYSITHTMNIDKLLKY